MAAVGGDRQDGMRSSIGAAAICLAVALLWAPADGARAQEAGSGATATELGPETNLPMPRYVSVRSSKVYVRRGPGLEYRIDWIFQRAGMPVKIIDEYGHWRRIADADNSVGWVYHALLTSRRMALVTAPELTFRARPDDAAPATATAEQGVVAHLLECQAEWCLIEAAGTEGWVRKSDIWGVEPGEVFRG